MSYEITSRDYLKRALVQLAEGSEQALFYAAFELRCGIEARMRQYLRAREDVSAKKANGWQLNKLAREIESAFITGNKFIRIGVRHKDSKELAICLYHTPVTAALKAQGEKLGDVLHEMKENRTSDDSWWVKFRTELTETAAALRMANRGILLGPPMLRKTEEKLLMEINIEDVFAEAVFSSALGSPVGQTVALEVSYPPSLPEHVEPEAILWNI